MPRPAITASLLQNPLMTASLVTRRPGITGQGRMSPALGGVTGQGRVGLALSRLSSLGAVYHLANTKTGQLASLLFATALHLTVILALVSYARRDSGLLTEPLPAAASALVS